MNQGIPLLVLGLLVEVPHEPRPNVLLSDPSFADTCAASSCEVQGA